MKNLKLISILVAYLICTLIPLSAFAAPGQTESSMIVQYTVNSSYEVEIPASINLNEESGFQFTATKCNLPSGKLLYVTVDKNKTYTSGSMRFSLFQNKGTESEKEIACQLRVSPSREESSYESISGSPGSSQIVAVFRNGETNPMLRGYMRFHINPSSGHEAGTYEGQIYFNIFPEESSYYAENS